MTFLELQIAVTFTLADKDTKLINMINTFNMINMMTNTINMMTNTIKMMINIINMMMINTPSKDARLPVQLQRAMAAEAEAAREARAKVGFNIVYRVGHGMVKIWPG